MRIIRPDRCDTSIDHSDEGGDCHRPASSLVRHRSDPASRTVPRSASPPIIRGQPQRRGRDGRSFFSPRDMIRRTRRWPCAASTPSVSDLSVTVLDRIVLLDTQPGDPGSLCHCFLPPEERPARSFVDASFAGEAGIENH